LHNPITGSDIMEQEVTKGVDEFVDKGRGYSKLSYLQAQALAEALAMRPLQAHCHLGLGCLYLTIGQRQQAHAALTTAIDLYRIMRMTFWLPEAEAALSQVEKGYETGG
jgi:hypothetical protein